ncbi:AI-2E family transporter [Paenibacillus campi]|uniref:AI-2E family transporter n=1 Tax=Paenibacillus campi TaxID=3106031 RepID=UPI002AFF3A50|nr:AI-2E family transporter [Paenibacillus sp. SGZ-1009]
MKFREWINHEGMRRIIVLGILILLIYSMLSMMNIVLMTLLLTILIGSLYKGVMKLFQKVIPNVSPFFVIPLVYVVLLAVISWGIYRMVPTVSMQVVQIYDMIQNVYANPHANKWNHYVVELMRTLNIEQLLENVGKFIGPGFTVLLKISQLGSQLFIAILLSLFFLLDRSHIARFTASFQDSKLSWFFTEVGYFGKMFLNTFGKVIEAQLLISFINTILTITMLWIMGFPNLIGLAVIVFVLGLVPVAGVFISLIPLGLTALSVGGIKYVVYLLILILIIHAIEAYLLNPKLMSSKTNLPVFYTFVILIFSEHFIGPWGLIIGIPLFVFFLDLIGVNRVKTSSGSYPPHAAKEQVSPPDQLS